MKQGHNFPVYCFFTIADGQLIATINVMEDDILKTGSRVREGRDGCD